MTARPRRIRVRRVDRPARLLVSLDGRVVASLPLGVSFAELVAVARSVLRSAGRPS